MDRSRILAHRGLYSSDSEKNSAIALQRAIDNGFGIETDLRDLNGRIVISHDPPLQSSDPLPFEWLLQLLRHNPGNARIALNIKADGLCSHINSLIAHSKIDSNTIFFFDMSIPDTLSYIKHNSPIYSRISEHEGIPAFLSAAQGVWVDNFSGGYPQVEKAQELIDKGFRVTLVSPELHKREHHRLWDEIHDSEIYLSELFELCTDLPHDAARKFCVS